MPYSSRSLASLSLSVSLGFLLPGCQQDQLGPLGDLPVGETLGACVDGPVDIVRDEAGIPHIYGQNLPDVSCAQGYVMAQDRLVQMDLLRRYASGTLAELLGALNDATIDSDISLRVHHLRGTAEEVWKALSASEAAEDKLLVQVLTRFAAGVNLYVKQLADGQRRLPGALALAYDAKNVAPWVPVDSLTLARLQAFGLAFDADAELVRTQAEAAAFSAFDMTTDPYLHSRRGLSSDLYRATPLDPAAILPDATRCSGKGAPTAAPPGPGDDPATRLYDWAGLRAAAAGLGRDHTVHPQWGSNNWVVAPGNTRDGHPLLANDTHLSLGNPPTFYLQELTAGSDLHVMGVQFPGLPGVVLGMNDHLAWGATDTFADVTDLYEEKILSCDGAPCVEWSDPQKPGKVRVPLHKRVEEIGVGRFGKIVSTRKVVLWDVPHHGPILPHIEKHDTAALTATEISVRYTGYKPTQEVRAVLALNRAGSVKEGVDAIERDFSVGSQNWIFADTGGHIGWTSHVELPRRPEGARPWVVMPGDGSAEWLPDGVPADKQPRALDPSCGFVASANNDPLGGPGGGGTGSIYHGWDYDVGVRAGRIEARLQGEIKTAAKLTVEKMQDIQADHHSFLGQLLTPVLLDAGDQLLAEKKAPGQSPDLTPVAQMLDAAGQKRVEAALSYLRSWKFQTPSGLDNEADAALSGESIATTIFNIWLTEFHTRTLGDEFQAIDDAMKPVVVPRPDLDYQRKLLLTAALTPEKLLSGMNGTDSVLFDDLRTRDRTETRREIAARALVAALDLLRGQLLGDLSMWQWGRLHRLTLAPLLPIDELKVPGMSDKQFPLGVPRHGDLYAVDAASFGVSYKQHQLDQDYNYVDGPAIRFVAELSAQGPRGWNILPGGQTFDPDSPHYADQFALWRHNQAFPLAFDVQAVAASAGKEASRGGTVRVRLTPP